MDNLPWNLIRVNIPMMPSLRITGECHKRMNFFAKLIYVDLLFMCIGIFIWVIFSGVERLVVVSQVAAAAV